MRSARRPSRRPEDQRRRERHAGDRRRRAPEPRDLERRDAREHRLLHDDRRGVRERRDEAEKDAEPRPRRRLGRREADRHTSGERDPASGEEPGREPLAEERARHDRDQDRPGVHEHRRRPGVDLPLRGVQGDAVEAQPQDAVRGDLPQVSAGRKRLPPDDRHRPERGAADQQPSQCECPGRERLPGRADTDERRFPCRHRDEPCGQRGHVAMDGDGDRSLGERTHPRRNAGAALLVRPRVGRLSSRGAIR